MSRAAAPLRDRLFASLGARAAPLRELVAIARGRGSELWLVGGPVRDLLLGLPVGDVDLMAAEPIDGLAREAARALGGELQFHERFGTATLATAELRLDLARARRERYPRPGALPVVTPSTIEEDLGRRDFGVNALALPLDRGDALAAVEGGLADLEARQLRVLHAASFRDDPTRLLRLGRYAARLGFRVEWHTGRQAAAARASDAFEGVSGHRVLQELRRLLAEEAPVPALARTRGLGVFEAIDPDWRPGREVSRVLRRWRTQRDEGLLADASPEVGLRILLLATPAAVRERLVQRLGLTGRRAESVLADLARLPALGRGLRRDPSPGRLDALLSPLDDVALLLGWCALPFAEAARIERYIRTLRGRSSPLGGHRARRLGAEGREIGELLRAARARALDGASVDDAWISRWLARHRAMG